MVNGCALRANGEWLMRFARVLWCIEAQMRFESYSAALRAGGETVM